MKRVDTAVVLRDSMLVQADDPVDPVNEAIRTARISGSSPSSPDAERYEYRAHHEYDNKYRVTVKAHATGTGVSREAAAASVQRGSFDEKEVLNYIVRDVAETIESSTTVKELRGLGREYNVTYPRSSTKADMVKELVDQAPNVAFDLAGQ